MSTTFEAPAEVSPDPVSVSVDPISASLGDWLREVIWTGWATASRSTQRAIGMSEVGTECERQLAYKMNQTPPINLDDDPMASLMGTGLHSILAEYVHKIHDGTGRWLIEHPVVFHHELVGDIPGTVDAYDRRRRLVLDWKSTSKAKLRTIRQGGPQTRYVVQAQLYAAALRQMGEHPERVALVYLPRDGKLTDLHVWSAPVDEDFIWDWVDRLARVRRDLSMHNDPSDAKPTPTRLCGWCPWHSPASTDTARSCPGQGK